MNKPQGPLLGWIEKKGWKFLPFQEEAWERIHEGKSGLISVPTGAGKTYAAYLPALSQLLQAPITAKGIQILYISPLKALAKDVEQTLKEPIIDLQLALRVEKRTGDTLASQKLRQKKSPPEILLTTPESLSLMLADKNIKAHFATLRMIIVDEWHEFLGSKRGVLLELCLAHLKAGTPHVQIWALTATIGNIKEAAHVCLGIDRSATIITAHMQREVIIESILPRSVDKLPWVGYLGLRMLPLVLEKLDPEFPTLIFTNTRSQAERWFLGILTLKPEWQPIIALHHSSIEKASRTAIEERIKSGELRFLVCTSGLDLGIDLPPVKKVIQVGSPKSVLRLIQRAGRASHRPLTPCHISLVPTHALQVLEIKAYRMAIQEHRIEERPVLKKCYDVLLQHIVTCAIGGGIEKMPFYEEIKTTACFNQLTLEEYETCLEFLIHGGNSLNAYSEYKKLVVHENFLKVEDPTMIRRHKMNIGTIVSDAYVSIKLLRGTSLGTVEESFISQLKPGDNFLFSGKCLKLVQYRDLTAYVRVTRESHTQTAVWSGTLLPFSAFLGEMLRRALEEKEITPENALLKEIFAIQQAHSHLPKENELLIEVIKSSEGWHLFLFPFEGKTLHEGLALLLAHRLTQATPSTLIISCNDYGIELLSKDPYDESMLNSTLFESTNCYEEVKELINLHEASKSTFREIARIGGLIFQGLPRKYKSNRQLQMSTSLLFNVLDKYDPDNLLIKQAKKETLDKYFAQNQMITVLKRLEACPLIITRPVRFTPFSLPLFVERVSQRISTETLKKRVETILKSWSKK